VSIDDCYRGCEELRDRPAQKRGWQLDQGRVLLGLGLFLTGLAYLAALRFDFVYDDVVQIVHNPILHSWRYLPRYFVEHNSASLLPDSLGNFYRPLVLSWKLINYELFGPNPFYWHLTNLALHTSVTALVYLLAKKIVKDEMTAALGALIFGLHPVNVEVVAWVSGATDSILALLMLSSFLLYLRFVQQPADKRVRRYLPLACSILLYCLAVLTKEAAVILPCLILVYEWLFREQGSEAAAGVAQGESSVVASKIARSWQVLGRSAPYAIVTAGYLALRYHVLHGLSHNNTNIGLGTAILTTPSVLWFYVKLLLIPRGLSPFYDLTYVETASFSGFFLPLMATIAVAFVLLAAARKSRAAAFGLACLVLPILPVLNFRVLQPDNFVHDRYLYLSSIGFSILAALGLRSLGLSSLPLLRAQSGDYSRTAALKAGVPLLLIGVLGAATASQSQIWQNEIVLYERGVALAPSNLAPRNNLAAALENRGKYREAIDVLSEVLSKNPRAWIAAYNLGIVYEHLGQFHESEAFYDRAIQIDPSESHPLYRKGIIKLDAAQLPEAESLARQAIALSPDEAGYHDLLGVVLERESKYVPALEEFKLEMAKHPEETDAMTKIKEVGDRLKSASQGSGLKSP
jgi:tetratricopeptide (TPR) repeat protein